MTLVCMSRAGKEWPGSTLLEMCRMADMRSSYKEQINIMLAHMYDSFLLLVSASISLNNENNLKEWGVANEDTSAFTP